MSPALTALFCLLATAGVWSKPSYIDETFTTNLMKNLATEGANMVISPASMQTPLGMIGFGAKGITEDQIFTTLGYTTNAEPALTEKQKHLKSEHTADVCWEFADKIMVSSNLLNKDYVPTVKEHFPGVEVQSYEFGNSTKTAIDVNLWVSSKTHSVIKKIIDPSSVGPDTKVVVLNADYFKGQWKHGFDKSKTKTDCFYSIPDMCSETTMMLTTSHFKYGHNTDWNADVIELPYNNENYSMVIVLPAPGALMNLISEINVDKLNGFIEAQSSIKVDVMMPKFDVEFKQEMSDTLVKMGMSYLFSSNADLSGLFNEPGQHIDSVIHMAKISIDEDGTLDGAAPADHGLKRSATYIQTFHVDHPFFYIIKKKDAGVLFSGIFSVTTN